MPITCSLTPDGTMAVFRHVGDVPDNEFLSSYREFLQAPALRDADFLVDLSETTSSHRSPGALWQLAEFLKELTFGKTVRRRIAIVAPTGLSFDLARMHESFSYRVPWEFAVFRERAAAENWLAEDKDAGSVAPNGHRTPSSAAAPTCRTATRT